MVWSEHSRPYKRETIATKFCDVLIVLEKAADKIYRVRVDTTSSLEFGPLYDGALVGAAELAEMVRLTVVSTLPDYAETRELSAERQPRLSDGSRGPCPPPAASGTSLLSGYKTAYENCSAGRCHKSTLYSKHGMLTALLFFAILTVVISLCLYSPNLFVTLRISFSFTDIVESFRFA